VPVSSFKIPNKTYCDGTLLGSAGNPTQLVRVDGFGVSRSMIDWNYNGSTSNFPQQDIDFDGIFESSVGTQTAQDFATHYTGADDWQLIKNNQGLRQVTISRSLFGQSLGVDVDDLAHRDQIDPSQLGDLEFGDLEFGDLEFGDLEFGDLEFGDLEFGDLEFGDLEFGEPETGGAGLGDLEFGGPSDEIDEAQAIDIGMNLAATDLTATPVYRQGSLQSVDLTWTAPSQGIVTKYTVYRSESAAVTAPLTPLVPPIPTSTSLSDTTAQKNRTYTYIVVPTYDDGTLGGSSNAATVTTR
jgi:hypothetical protein